MGSELIDRSSGDVLWGMSPLDYARLWTSNRAITRLHLTDAERAGDHRRVHATRLLRTPAATPGLGGFEPYRAMAARLRERVADPSAVEEFPYDWRLAVPVNAAYLAEAAAEHLRRWRRHPRGSRDARLVLVAHSMGGLVAGYFTERLGGRDLVRLTVTLGTPFYGSVKAAHLLNAGRGSPVPLPRARLRKLAVTLPGVHDLLPSYRCREENGVVHRLTPADVASLGGDPELARDSLRLHEVFAEPDSSRLRPVIGVEQPTMQSMRLEAGVVVPQWHIPDGGREIDHAGDGTVYLEAALGGVHPIAALPQSHGGIARTREALAAVTVALTNDRLTPSMGAAGPGIDVPDTVVTGELVDITITSDRLVPPGCRVFDLETNALVDRPRPRRHNGGWAAALRLRHTGAYRIEVKDGGFAPVTEVVLALPAEEMALAEVAG
ncbi:esterase/lipase family protein [Actinoplanes sp. CA-252034]|uniref:esterase/lipase family protein n=1 Tax=Actinoplanes sp. CA-252034 TaxID=3239906 RepID=UPI003D99410A